MNVSAFVFMLVCFGLTIPNCTLCKEFTRNLRVGRQSGESGKETETKEPESAPGPVSLGSFESYAHGLSGEVTILDEKTIEINGLNYDGTGPAAWFMLGSESRSTLPEFTELDGTVIPDESESCDTLSAYSDADIKIKLPGKMKISDFNYLAMYCLRFNHNFGYVTIPSDLKLKNGTAKAGLEKCPEDDLAAAEDDNNNGGSAGNRRPSRPSGAQRPVGSRPTESTGLLDSLLNLLF